MTEVQVPNQAVNIIDYTITEEEGGYVITHNPNDPDGGWTYAGIIKENWVKYYPETDVGFSAISALVLANTDLYQTWSHVIYYNEFYLPVQKILGTIFDVDQEEFSCAVNIGLGGFEQVCQLSGPLHGKLTFLEEWLHYYAELVRKNAEAWKAYALREPGATQPETLRAEFLAGWISRVTKFF
jgi:hypothetical protein